MAITPPVRFRRYSSTQWANSNPVLLDGEPGWDSTAKQFKVGDGVHRWVDLDYYEGALDNSGLPAGFNALTGRVTSLENDVSGIHTTDLPSLAQQITQLRIALETLGGGGPVGTTVPTAVRNLLTSATTTTATGTWQAPESNGGAALTGYRVTLYSNGNPVATSALLSTGTLTYTFTGLNSNTPYSFSVVAVNSVGGSTPFAVPVTTLNSSTAPTPDKPTATVTGVTDTSITLDWAYPTSPAQTIGAVRFIRETASTTGVGTVKIMPAGDSLTAVDASALGYKGVLLNTLVNGGKSIDYVGSKLSTGPAGLKDPNHEGLSGAQNSTFLGQYLDSVPLASKITTYNPDVLTYLVGVNDLWSNVATATALSRLNQVLTDCFAAKPTLKVVLCKIPLMGVAQESQRAAYNTGVASAVSTFAAAGKAITLADLSSTLVAGDLQGDGIHWTTSGHDKVAAALYPVVLAAVNSVTGAGAVQSFTSADFASPADPYVFTGLTADTVYSVSAEMVYAGSGGTPTTPLVGPLTFTGSNGSAPGANIALGFPTDGSRRAIQGNKLRLTAGTTGGYTPADRAIVHFADGSGVKLSRSNIDISLTISTPLGNGYAGVFTNSANVIDVTQSSYSVELIGGANPQLVRASGYTFTTLATAAAFAPVEGTTYNLRMRVFNGLIQVWIWDIGSSQPSSPTMAATDASPLAAGYSGAEINYFGYTDIDDVTISDGASTGGGSVGTTGPRITVTARTNKTPVNPPNADSNLPSGRIAEMYLWRWSAPTLATVGAQGPNAYNLYSLFVAQSAGSGTGAVEYSPFGGDAAFLSHKAALPSTNRYILCVGGGGDGGITITNPTQVTQFVNSVKAIITRLGLHGIDWDLENPAAYNVTSLVDASNQLRTWYETTYAPGTKFIVGMVPRGWETAPFQVAQALGNNLDILGFQFYDAPEYSTFSQGSPYIRGYIAKAINTYGIPASKILLGFIANPYSNGGVSPALALQYYNDIKSIYPTIRGFFAYDSGHEGNVTGWALTSVATAVRAS